MKSKVRKQLSHLAKLAEVSQDLDYQVFQVLHAFNVDDWDDTDLELFRALVLMGTVFQEEHWAWEKVWEI